METTTAFWYVFASVRNRSTVEAPWTAVTRVSTFVHGLSVSFCQKIAGFRDGSQATFVDFGK